MLIEAIASALAQTYDNLEIIVIDDGSTDDTAARIKPYVDRGLIHYLFQQNRRQAAAKNAGIDSSRGELIAFLDHDDLWAPSKLEKQVPLFEPEDVGLVYSGAKEVDLNGSFLWEKGSVKYRRGRIFDHLLFDHFITNSSVIIRRSCLARTGAFREDLFGVDDIHLWLRICHDYQADYVPDTLVACRNHGANMKKDPYLITDKRYLALADVFRRFGLDRSARSKWHALHADYLFSLGYRYRKVDRLRALACFLKSFGYQPRWRGVGAITKLLIPGYYTIADIVRRYSEN